MRAKMLRGQKMPEAGEYQCQRCDYRFCCSGGQLSCCNCGSRDMNGLVLIYLEDNPDEYQMYNAIDWHAGD